MTTKAELRAELEKEFAKWKKEGGVPTKGPEKKGTTGVNRNQQPRLKGAKPLGPVRLRSIGHHAIDSPKLPAGGAAIANVEEAQKKKAAKKKADREAARIRNAKKADAAKKAAAKQKKAEAAKKAADNNGTKPDGKGKKISGGGKLPVSLKVLKEAAKSGTIDDIAAAFGKYSGQIRKWYRNYMGPKAGPKKDIVPKKDMKPPSQRSKLPAIRKDNVPKKNILPPAIRSKPQPGTSKIPRSGIKPPSQSGKPKPLPSGVKPKAAIPPITSGDDKGKGRGTYTPYSVKKGDTLSEIARDKGTTLKALLAANNIAAKDANKLRIGQKLVLPGKVKDRKSVYQGMTKSQMAAMHMPKNKPKRSQTIGEGNIDPLHGTTRKNKHDVSKYSDMTKKKPIKKQPINKKPIQDRYKYFGKPGETIGDISRKLEIKYDTKPKANLPHEEGYEGNKRGGQIKGYKKGGKVKKVRKASRPRGVGIALRGWGKAMR